MVSLSIYFPLVRRQQVEGLSAPEDHEFKRLCCTEASKIHHVSSINVAIIFVGFNVQKHDLETTSSQINGFLHYTPTT